MRNGELIRLPGDLPGDALLPPSLPTVPGLTIVEWSWWRDRLNSEKSGDAPVSDAGYGSKQAPGEGSGRARHGGARAAVAGATALARRAKGGQRTVGIEHQGRVEALQELATGPLRRLPRLPLDVPGGHGAVERKPLARSFLFAARTARTGARG